LFLKPKKGFVNFIPVLFTFFVFLAASSFQFHQVSFHDLVLSSQSSLYTLNKEINSVILSKQCGKLEKIKRSDFDHLQSFSTGQGNLPCLIYLKKLVVAAKKITVEADVFCEKKGKISAVYRKTYGFEKKLDPENCSTSALNKGILP